MTVIKEQLAQTVGDFSWNFANSFHIETPLGNFEWSCPSYPGGDNTIRPCGTLAQWLAEQNIEFCRSKGHHIVGHYCPNFVLV